MERLFQKYLFEATKPKSSGDAQKAVETMAAQLASAILALDKKFHDTGGEIEQYMKQAEAKAKSVVSKLHPDGKVISHFLETFRKALGKSVNNEIPGVVSKLLGQKAGSAKKTKPVEKPKPGTVTNQKPDGVEKNKHREIARKALDAHTKSDVETPTEPHKISEKEPPTEKEKRKARIEKISEKSPLGKEDPVIGLLERIDKKKISKSTNPIKSTVFKSDHVISDQDWSKKNKSHEVKNPQTLSGWSTGTKYPASVAKTIERMFNSKLDGTTSGITHFIPTAGKGEIRSQCGEMMSMMLSTMTDDQVVLLKKSMNKSFEARGEGDFVLTKDWFQAAVNNRSAMHGILKNSFPGINIPEDIESTAWDDEEQIKSIGIEDKDSLEKTSDVFMVIKNKSGERQLLEFSLKKDKKVRFQEKGVNQLIPKEHKHSSSNYTIRQNNILKSYYSPQKQSESVKAFEDMSSFYSRADVPENAKQMKETVKQYKYYEEWSILNKLIGKKNKGIGSLLIDTNNDDSRHVMNLMLKIRSGEGDKDAKSTLEDVSKNYRQYSNDATEALIKDPDCKKRLIKYIDEEFPLRGMCEGVENMCIGDVGINKNVFKTMFGVSRWEQVTENFEVKADKDDKYHLVYKAKGSDIEIPICFLQVRQRGIGYKSGINIEMSMHPKLYEAAKTASESVLKNEGIMLPGVTMKINENIFMKKYLFKHK